MLEKTKIDTVREAKKYRAVNKIARYLGMSMKHCCNYFGCFGMLNDDMTQEVLEQVRAEFNKNNNVDVSFVELLVDTIVNSNHYITN